MTDWDAYCDARQEADADAYDAYLNDLEDLERDAAQEAAEQAAQVERDRWIRNAADLLDRRYEGVFTRPELLQAASALRDALDEQIPEESGLTADGTVYCPGGYTVERPGTDADHVGPGWWLYYEDEVVAGPFDTADDGVAAWYRIAADYAAKHPEESE